jgi:hypothetical protein
VSASRSVIADDAMVVWWSQEDSAQRVRFLKKTKLDFSADTDVKS